MKKAILQLCILLSPLCYNFYGQNTGNLQLPFPQSDYVQIVGMSSKDVRDISNNNTDNKIDGSPYLFDSWNNSAKVFYQDREYVLKSFNYNIYKGRFEAKISNDSVFVINPINVKKVNVNGNVFSHYFDPESQETSYFEELIDFDDFRILIKYNVKIKSGPINPLTNEKLSNDQITKYEKYYLCKLQDNTLTNINLNKTNIQSLFTKEKLYNINKYVKDNHLKYNNISDVINMV
jgi:hypothetical protein